MNKDDHTYTIDPDNTDPDLIRTLRPLGEADDSPAPRPSPRRRRSFPTMAAPAGPPPVRHPVRHLLTAYFLGSLSLLQHPSGERRPLRLILALAPIVTAAATAMIWLRATDLVGPGDQAIVLQLTAAAIATTFWLVVWSVGLVNAHRRCGDGPLARRGERRPLLAGVAGWLAPGLGLLLAGRIWRTVISLSLLGSGLVAGLALWRSPAWWTDHRAAPAGLLTDLQCERLAAILASLALLGLLTWLVSMLEAGRLARGPVVVRRLAGADRVPALLLLSLVAFGIFFRPATLASELDRFTDRLVAADLRLIPMWITRTATILDPAEPAYGLRLAARYEDLGRADEAAAVRDRLARRWDRYQAGNPAAASVSAKTPVVIWAPTPVSHPQPVAPLQTARGSAIPRPAP